MRIAIDAMGSDNAPRVEVEGSVQAAREYGFDLILVGDEQKIRKELAGFSRHPSNISICHASEVVQMDESPAVAVRRKKDSSISVAVNLVREKKASAVVSAGNTGAVVCAATLSLRLLEGVERPGIAIVAPTIAGNAIVIDVGANVEPKPRYLLQHAIMADVYSRDVLKKVNPTVGLLNIGEEETKGTDFVKETYKLLEQSGLNFIGNVEGRDIFAGKSDVVVCDGFSGNILLKVSESMAEAMGEFLIRELQRTFVTRLGLFLSRPALRAFKKRVDYTEYGGALLLGVNGVCVISHGRSTPKAIKNAIRVAAEAAEKQVNKHIMDKVHL
jgi:glycerol-3-phosphate acyltransferase PlsX